MPAWELVACRHRQKYHPLICFPYLRLRRSHGRIEFPTGIATRAEAKAIVPCVGRGSINGCTKSNAFVKSGLVMCHGGNEVGAATGSADNVANPITCVGRSQVVNGGTNTSYIVSNGFGVGIAGFTGGGAKSGGNESVAKVGS